MPRPPITPPQVRRVSVAVVLVFGTALTLSSTGALAPRASRTVIDLAQLGAGLFATGAYLWTWRRSTAPDRTWRLLLGLGLAGWTAGQAVGAWAVFGTGIDAPTPIAVDAAALALPLLALPALLLLPSSPRQRGPRRIARTGAVLDGLVVAGSLLALTWLALHTGTIQQETTRPVAFGLAFARTVLDLALVTVAVLLVATRVAPRPAVPLMLGGAFAAMALSDLLLLGSRGNGPDGLPDAYELGLVIGPLLLGFAALHPQVTAERRSPAGATPRTAPGTLSGRTEERVAVLLPSLPLGVGLVVVLVLHGRAGGGDRTLILIGLLVVAALMLRQVVTLLDNTRLMRAVHDGQDLLTRHAYHDSLTGVANRALFRERLDDAVAAHRTHGRPFALLFCDLDDFKIVNDQLGHACGDEVLRTVGSRLRTCVSPQDTVARLGGDEFAVLLDSGGDSPGSVAELILVALSRPIAVMLDPQTVPGAGSLRSDVPASWPTAQRRGPSSTEVTIGSSLGLVVLDEDDPPVTADLLLARVDAAMYAAKRRGKNRFVTFRGDLPLEELSPSLVGELRVLLTAMQEGFTPPPEVGEIEVWYQPVVQIPDGGLVSLEALVRWRHPRFGLLPAQLLVGAAADSGLLDVLENLILTMACRDICELRSEPGLGHVAVHVNVSAQRTCEVELLTTVRQELHRYGLPGEALVIEVTESNRVPDLRAAVAVLSTLRGDGVRLALDDFGSGFSGLSYLMELPVDIVKLDRSLVVAPPGSRAAAVARAAAVLTLGLGLELIAEGVETPEQVTGLIELGCRRGQGYRYAKPSPMNDVRAWIDSGADRRLGA